MTYKIDIIGQIDLSTSRVTEEEDLQCKERYNKALIVDKIFRNVLIQHTNFQLEDIYGLCGWPLHNKYGNIYDAFKLIFQ